MLSHEVRKISSLSKFVILCLLLSLENDGHSTSLAIGVRNETPSGKATGGQITFKVSQGSLKLRPDEKKTDKQRKCSNKGGQKCRQGNADINTELNITKRSSYRARRFLSNLKSKLKDHINNPSSWKLSTKEAKEVFYKYNQCLQERVKTLKAEEFPIKAFMTVAGDTLALKCDVCYRPDRDKKSQEAKWQVLLHESSAVMDIQTSKKLKVTEGNTLILEDISVADAGQYFCVDRSDYAAIYQVDVFLTDRRRHIKFKQEWPRREVFLFRRNLRVFTMWASWSQCNTCDRVGHKVRIGQCMVKKIYSDSPVFPRDYPLMVLYPEGVPCHSTALPRHLRQLPDIGFRYSETLISPCMEPCPTEPPLRIITDETGKAVEVLEPGFYSMMSKPTLPPLIKRKVLYEPEKSHLVLNCPTKEGETSLIHWLRGTREVDPASIKRQTEGRVWVDSLSRLHLKPLLLSDTAVYK